MKLSKKLIAILTAMTFLTACPMASSAEDGMVNVALGKNVTASGHTYGMAPQAVVDGDEITGWSSETANNTWLTIDLGRRMKISRIEWVPRTNLDQPHTRNYFYIECSNSPGFTTYDRVGEVGAEGVPDKSTYRIDVNESYRYVRYRKYSGDYSFIAEIRVLVNEDDMPSEDGTVSELSNRISLFKKLGVDMSSLSDTVTRGEAAVVFAQLLKAQPGGEFFSDIKDKTVETAANALCGIGILSENGGRFNPGKEITYDQAIKMAICTLGGSVKAEHSGGFPTGYIVCAKELGITKDVNASEFKKEDFINLLYNMLDSKLYEASSFSETTTSYQKKDTTFLYEYFGIKKCEGVLNETNLFTMFMNSSVSDEKRYLINGELFYSADKDYSELFANGVVCYYTDYNAGVYDIVLMYPIEEQTVTTIDIADFLEITSGSIRYRVADKTESVSLDSQHKIMLNGRIVGASAVGTLSADGMIAIYDNDGDGAAEFVKITETKTRVIEKVKRIDDEITLYFTDGDKHTEKEDVKSYVRYSNGDVGKFTDLTVDDVVSICEGNTSIFEAYVGSETVEGKLTSYTTDEVVINWKYVYSVSAGAQNPGEGYMNNYGTLYFDYFGKAFFFDNNVDDGERYAIWTAIAPADGMVGGADIKLFTDTGKFSIYNIEAPIVIDGTSYTDTATAVTTLENILSTCRGSYVGIPVRYTANSYLKITKIETENSPGFAKLDDAATTTGEYYCQGIWDERFIVDADTIVFEIPDDVNDEDKFKVGTAASWGELRKTTLSGFGDSDPSITMPKFDVIVMPTIRPGFDEDVKTLIIDKAEETYVDEETVYNLSGWYMGAYVTYSLHDDFAYLAPHFSRGDVIQFALTGNQIANMMYIYNNGGSRIDGELDATARPHLTIYYGNTYMNGNSVFNEPLYAYVGAYAQEDNFIKMAPLSEIRSGSLTGFNFIIDASKPTIFIYDSVTGKIKQGTVDDIIAYQDNTTDYSEMYVKVFRGRPREIVIYR